MRKEENVEMERTNRLFSPVLESVVEEKKTDEITIRKSTIAFYEVDLESRNDQEHILIEQRQIKVPPERRFLSLPPTNIEFPLYRKLSKVSEQTGIPKRTLRNWCRKGKIEALTDDKGHWWIKDHIHGEKINGRWKIEQLVD